MYLEWPDASATSGSASPKSPKVIVITMSGYLVITIHDQNIIVDEIDHDHQGGEFDRNVMENIFSCVAFL